MKSCGIDVRDGYDVAFSLDAGNRNDLGSLWFASIRLGPVGEWSKVLLRRFLSTVLAL